MNENKNVIFGAGLLGTKLLKFLANKDIVIDYFVDNDKLKHGTDIDCVCIKSFDEMLMDNENCNIQLYVAAQRITDIVNQLYYGGFKGCIYLLKDKHILDDNTSNYEDLVYKLDFDNPMLDYIEYEVASNCNLNCKGCTHYSNLIKEKTFGDYSQFKKDLEQIKTLFCGVERIRLLGAFLLGNK